MSGTPLPLRECASCGGQWFQLIDHDLPRSAGAVCVNELGRIAGRSGDLVCVRCGAVLDEIAPEPRKDLRLVQ